MLETCCRAAKRGGNKGLNSHWSFTCVLYMQTEIHFIFEKNSCTITLNNGIHSIFSNYAKDTPASRGLLSSSSGPSARREIAIIFRAGI